eukprot:gene25724-27981_t
MKDACLRERPPRHTSAESHGGARTARKLTKQLVIRIGTGGTRLLRDDRAAG